MNTKIDPKTIFTTQNETDACPNCQQWQNWTPRGYYDCLHDCAERGFAPKRPTPGAIKPPAKPADAHPAGAHTPSDRWEPVREKLSIGQAQYLNTYIKTGDIAVLESFVLGIILQRDETADECDKLRVELRHARSQVVDALKLLDQTMRERDQAREQVKTLTQACKRLTRWVGKGIASDLFKECVAPKQAENDLRFAEATIASVEGSKS